MVLSGREYLSARVLGGGLREWLEERKCSSSLLERIGRLHRVGMMRRIYLSSTMRRSGVQHEALWRRGRRVILIIIKFQVYALCRREIGGSQKSRCSRARGQIRGVISVHSERGRLGEGSRRIEVQRPKQLFYVLRITW